MNIRTFSVVLLSSFMLSNTFQITRRFPSQVTITSSAFRTIRTIRTKYGSKSINNKKLYSKYDEEDLNDFNFIHQKQNKNHKETRIKNSAYDKDYLLFFSQVSKEIYFPKTENQKKYIQYLNNNQTTVIVAIGSAGSGKTLFACLKAIELLKNKKINKIIITRPIVSVEEELGFLPGNINKKMDPYMRPLFDIFEEFYSVKQINDMIYNGQIEISPLAYMRGRTFKNAFIIADEMQNSSPNQMLMLLTRIGSNCRMVITGDLSQTDKTEKNGLKDFVDKISSAVKQSNEKNETQKMDTSIQMVYFNHSDIQRNPIVEKILSIYDSFPASPLVVSDSHEKKYHPKINHPANQNHKNSTSEDYPTNNENDKKEKERERDYSNDCALIPLNHYKALKKYQGENYGW